MTILSSRRHGRIRRHGWDRRQCEFFFDSEPVREMKLIGNSSVTGGSARTVARHRLARSSGYRPPPKGEMARRLTVIPHSAAPGTAGPPPVVPRQSPRTIAKLLFVECHGRQRRRQRYSFRLRQHGLIVLLALALPGLAFGVVRRNGRAHRSVVWSGTIEPRADAR